MKQGTLRWRVLLVLALAAIVPTIVVGALAIFRARADVEREVLRGALAHIRALGAVLDGTLQDARRTVELAAATWADTTDDAQKTQLLVKRLRRDVPIVHSLSIVDVDGALRHGDPVPASANVGTQSFGGYVGDAVHVEGRSIVQLVVQARGRTGELMGTFVASLDLGFVRDVVSAARLGAGARVLVVDGAGVPVASSDLGPLGTQSLAGRDPAVDRALASSVEGTIATNGWVSAYRNLSSYQSLRGVRWAILHQQPEAEAYALAQRTTRDTLIMGGVALAIALALGVFFATRLTRPLEALARRADAIASAMVAPADPAARRTNDSTDDDVPIDGPGEIGILGQRVNEMAKRIAERAELQAALARGDRLASVGVMSAQVAHEINNPLTTVMGYANLLLEDKPEGHPDRTGLELIASEAQRMKSIIGGLLEYARTPRGSQPSGSVVTAGPVATSAADRGDSRVPSSSSGTSEPAQVARHVGALLEPQLKKARLRFVTDVQSATPLAIDAHALQQVLVNLVQNAAQAMSATQDPDAQTGVVRGNTITLTIRPAPGAVATQILVRDEGPGVAPADRAKIFDPFFTTKAAGVGTGLGLAVCKHLVATAGGSIELGEGPDGRGAEFRLVIPNSR
ncbi:MAG: ATP-binding protein [Kofleriaceae bacterium]